MKRTLRFTRRGHTGRKRGGSKLIKNNRPKK